MTPGNLLLDLYRGDSYEWRFVLWADLQKTQPADLTGVTAKAEIRSAPGGTLITTIDCTVEQPNTVVANLSATNSSLLQVSGGSWDLQLTYSTGAVSTILEGSVKVTMDVTDSAGAAGLTAGPSSQTAMLQQVVSRVAG